MADLTLRNRDRLAGWTNDLRTREGYSYPALGPKVGSIVRPRTVATVSRTERREEFGSKPPFCEDSRVFQGWHGRCNRAVTQRTTLMKNETTNLNRPPNLLSLIPTDLRAWLPAIELARAAREAAKTFYWVEADEEDHTPFGGCACPLRKLAALTYCYAAGTLADDLIALEMVEDPALRSLTGAAVFAPDKLRLFRAHNAELLKLCLTRVLEQAWHVNIGERGTSRHFFAAEAAFRVQLAWQAAPQTAIAKVDESACEFEYARLAANTFRLFLPRFASAACGLFILLCCAVYTNAAETLPTFAYEGKTYTNATVVEATSVDVLLRHDTLGFTRIKRQEMPDELKARFPYDATAAAAYAQEKAAKAAALREQARANTLAALQRQQTELQAGIYAVERQLAALQRELDVLNVSARGKPHSAARQQADRYRLIKQDYIRHADQLRDQLEQVRTRQSQFR